MANVFNPFSGLGKIDSYVKWATFRGLARSLIQSKAIKKFGNRWGKKIKSALSSISLTRRVAISLDQSGPTRNLQTLTLPLGKNKSKTIRVSGQIKNSKFKLFGASKNNARNFVIDLPRNLTKRQMRKSIRDQILDAFFSHYEIANKYRSDFNRRFGDIDIIEVEGV